MSLGVDWNIEMGRKGSTSRLGFLIHYDSCFLRLQHLQGLECCFVYYYHPGGQLHLNANISWNIVRPTADWLCFLALYCTKSLLPSSLCAAKGVIFPFPLLCQVCPHPICCILATHLLITYLQTYFAPLKIKRQRALFQYTVQY